MIRGIDASRFDDADTPVAVTVGGVRFANTAAKFWPALVDEVRCHFPDCTRIELSASTACRFSRALLFPEVGLAKALRRLDGVDVPSEIRNTLAEMRVLGPPSPVTIRLGSAHGPVHPPLVLADVVDSDLFPYLAVWMLEWAGIAPGQWGRERIAGTVSLDARSPARIYAFDVELRRTHLAEGLYRYDMALAFSVTRRRDKTA
jgi:hypothetical protein